MPDQDPIIVRTFSAHEGIQNREAPWTLGENAVAYAENLELGRQGRRTRRAGAGSIGAASAASNIMQAFGLWTTYDAQLLQESLYGVWHNALYAVPGAGYLVERACGVSLTSALHMMSRGYWRGIDTSYITNAQVNDSAASSMTNLLAMDVNGNHSQAASMAPRCATWWQGRLWAADNVLSQDYDTLWWSSLNDGLSFSGLNTVRIEPGRGGRITGLYPLRGTSPRLVVWKERMIALFEVYWGSSSSLIPQASDALDTVQSRVVILSDDVGCLATKSIASISGSQAGEVMFLSHDGFRALSRAADDSLQGASLPISSTFQDTIDRINFSHAHKAVACVWDQRYFCAVPLDGAVHNTHVVSFNLITGDWGLHKWQARDLTRSRLTQTADRMWMQYGEYTTDSVATGAGGAFGGWHVFRTFTGDVEPGGRTVPFTEHSRAYTFGSLDQRKSWDWMSIHAYNLTATCTIDVAVKIDNDSSVSVGQFVIPPAGGTTVVLGGTPLVWSGLPNGIHMRKLSLRDVGPGYMIQTILTQTGSSDFGGLTIVQTAVSAFPIPPEQDNNIT